MDQYSRTRLLLGKAAMEKLRGSSVAVFGIGGVGGYAVEALARSGVGTIGLIDDDKVCLSNLNRQIIADHSTIGQYKTDAAKARINAIDPDIRVNTYKCFYMPQTAEQIDLSQYDYIIDAIDTVTGKLEIIKRAKALDIPVISSMGAGNKLDPTAFRVADIFKTSVCPLAKVMRQQLRRLGIKSLKVVYSEEPPLRPAENSEDTEDTAEKGSSRRSVPGSAAFVPSVAGLIIAGEVIKDLTREERDGN